MPKIAACTRSLFPLWNTGSSGVCAALCAVFDNNPVLLNNSACLKWQNRCHDRCARHSELWRLLKVLLTTSAIDRSESTITAWFSSVTSMFRSITPLSVLKRATPRTGKVEARTERLRRNGGEQSHQHSFPKKERRGRQRRYHGCVRENAGGNVPRIRQNKSGRGGWGERVAVDTGASNTYIP